MSCNCQFAPAWPLVETRANVFVGTAPSWPVLIADANTCQSLPNGIAGSSWTLNVTTASGLTVVTLSTGNGGIAITDAEASEIQIDWTQGQTELLSAGTAYRYDLIGHLASGEIYVAIYGTLNARSITPSAS
jgi:hypothetical protein